MTRKQQRRLWDRGAADFRAGKPIEAFYEVPRRLLPGGGLRAIYSRAAREAYEMGFKSEQTETEKGN